MERGCTVPKHQCTITVLKPLSETNKIKNSDISNWMFLIKNNIITCLSQTIRYIKYVYYYIPPLSSYFIQNNMVGVATSETFNHFHTKRLKWNNRIKNLRDLLRKSRVENRVLLWEVLLFSPTTPFFTYFYKIYCFILLAPQGQHYETNSLIFTQHFKSWQNKTLDENGILSKRSNKYLWYANGVLD